MKGLTLAADSAKKLIWIVPLIYIVATSTEGQRRQLQYEPEKVILTGRVVAKTFYGPPNYGETPKIDGRERQYILVLDSAVDVIGSKSETLDEPERGVKELTLIAMASLEPFLGKHVKVDGTLFHAVSAHHHTKVLIMVSSIKRAR